jgi:hypothetical protein
VALPFASGNQGAAGHYAALHRALEEDFQPVDFIDRQTVALLADELWRLRIRVAAAEQGAIRKRAGHPARGSARAAPREFEADKKYHPAHLKQTSLGLQYLIEELDGRVTEIERLDLVANPLLPLEQLPECLAQDLASLQQAVCGPTSRGPQAFVLRRAAPAPRDTDARPAARDSTKQPQSRALR